MAALRSSKQQENALRVNRVQEDQKVEEEKKPKFSHKESFGAESQIKPFDDVVKQEGYESPTIGTKYQGVLNGPSNDNFKNSFHLTLHTGNSPAKEAEHGNFEDHANNLHSPEETKQLGLIPPKSDLKPAARKLVDQFHDSVGQSKVLV